jgi:tRNA threonylcarbamoyladenosine biosynthesis protein TsaB
MSTSSAKRPLPSPMLVLEASTRTGSVAVIVDDAVAATTDVATGVSRDDGLFPAILSLLSQCGLGAADLAAVACGAGPGGFTSLRIAASLAKGIAHGAGIPLFAVPSLLLAVGDSGAGAYVVHSDAMRGERFAQRVLVDQDGLVFADGVVQRVPGDDLRTFSGGVPLISAGPSPQADLADVVRSPAASAVTRIGDWSACGPVMLARWEPDYGRLAEAQVVWERSHGFPLPAN